MPTICAQCGKEHETKEELDAKASIPAPKKQLKLKKALKSEPYRDPE